MSHSAPCLSERSPVLDIAGLESAYETLASALDAVGRDKSELFLVKLALLCAREIGDARRLAALVESARKDL